MVHMLHSYVAIVALRHPHVVKHIQLDLKQCTISSGRSIRNECICILGRVVPGSSLASTAHTKS